MPKKLETNVLSLTPDILQEEFCKLSIHNFLSGNIFPYPIYIKLSDSKIALYAKTGKDLTEDKVNELKTRNIESLYLRKNDFRTHVGICVKIIKKINSKDCFSTSFKREFLNNTSEVIFEQIFVNSLQKEEFLQVKDFTETCISILLDDDSTAHLLNLLSNHSDYLYAHSLAVSLYSVAVARECGWNSTPTLFKLSVGGIFHDIGTKEIQHEIFEINRVQMTCEQRLLFESHCVRGRDILRSIDYIHEDIVAIAYQHHESNDGLGFPQHLRKLKTHPLARLVAVVDAFCCLIITPGNKNNMTPLKAMEHINKYDTTFDKDFVQALNSMIKKA